MSAADYSHYPATIQIRQVTVYYIFRKCLEKISRKDEQINMRQWSSKLFHEIEKVLGKDPYFRPWFISKRTRTKYFNGLYLAAKDAMLNGTHNTDIISPDTEVFLPLLLFSGINERFGYLDTCLGSNEHQQIFVIKVLSKTDATFNMTVNEADFDRQVSTDLPVIAAPNPQKASTAPNNLKQEIIRAEVMLRHEMPAPPVYFVGREEQLADCHHLLTGTGPVPRVLLLHGIGGMGKTTLMQHYLYRDQCEHYFNRIVYMVIDHDLTSAYIDTAAKVTKCVHEVNGLTTVEAQLKMVTAALSEIKDKNLFVIDNVNESDFDQLRSLKSYFERTGWRFLITTRTAPDGFLIRDVTELEMADAMLLFACHWWPELVIPGDSPATNTVLNEKIVATNLATDLQILLDHIFRHTLLTELLAKAGRKKGLTVKQLYEKLLKEDFRHQDLNRKIDPGAHPIPQTQINETTLHQYMLGLFDTDYLLTPDNQEHRAKAIMLLFFSVLPATDIPTADLVMLWDVPETEIIDFENRLDDLRQIGWLQAKYAYTDDPGRHQTDYKMHKLVQEVVKEKLKPTLKDCLPLVETLSRIVLTRGKKAQKYQVYAESIMKRFGFFK